MDGDAFYVLQQLYGLFFAVARLSQLNGPEVLALSYLKRLGKHLDGSRVLLLSDLAGRLVDAHCYRDPRNADVAFKSLERKKFVLRTSIPAATRAVLFESRRGKDKIVRLLTDGEKALNAFNEQFSPLFGILNEIASRPSFVEDFNEAMQQCLTRLPSVRRQQPSLF